MGKLMGDDRFGLGVRLRRFAVEQDDRPEQAPADRRGKVVAGQQRGSVLEPHPPLRMGQRAQPMRLDQHGRARLQHDQPAERDQGEQDKQRGRNGIGPDWPIQRLKRRARRRLETRRRSARPPHSSPTGSTAGACVAGVTLGRAGLGLGQERRAGDFQRAARRPPRAAAAGSRPARDGRSSCGRSPSGCARA